MIVRLLACVLISGLAVAGATRPAGAQSAMCQRYRAELSALDRGSTRSQDGSERQRTEIGRMTSYYRSIGCDRGGLSFFDNAPPAECAAIAQRIRSMEANYDRLARSEFEERADPARRSQLASIIAEACQEGRPGAFDRRREPIDDPFEDRYRSDRDDIVQQPGRITDEGSGERGFGGGRMICVKSCDGSYFPLENLPEGRGGADAMCQALCPGTEAKAYSIPHGPSSLDQAVSLHEERYSDLPNALRFQKKFDASCACKKEGESWAKVLERAESMLDQHRGDVVLTAEKAEELSRPKARPSQARDQARDQRDKIAKPKPVPKPVRAGASGQTAAAAAVDSNAEISADRPAQKAGVGTAKPKYRVVAPGLAPGPDQSLSRSP